MGTKDAPAPRLMCAHTFNFNLTYRGTSLSDGKCKLMVKSEDESILVLHSSNQFAYKDTPLAMLTTNNFFWFFSSHKNIGREKVITSVCEMKMYKLSSVTDITVDSDDDAEWLPAPPPF